VSPYLHCSYNVVNWEGGQQVHCKPACQVPLGNGPVIRDKIARHFVLHKQGMSAQAGQQHFCTSLGVQIWPCFTHAS
jgi:hypothetical protein